MGLIAESRTPTVKYTLGTGAGKKTGKKSYMYESESDVGPSP